MMAFFATSRKKSSRLEVSKDTAITKTPFIFFTFLSDYVLLLYFETKQNILKKKLRLFRSLVY